MASSGVFDSLRAEFLSVSSRDSLTPSERVIIAIHAILYHGKFECSGLENGDEITNRKCEMPAGWNNSKQEFAFQFYSLELKRTFLLRAIVCEDTLLVTFQPVGQEQQAETIELQVASYVDGSLQGLESYKDLSGLQTQIEALVSPLTSQPANPLSEPFRPNIRPPDPDPMADPARMRDPLAVGPPRRPIDRYQPPMPDEFFDPMSVGRRDLDPFARSGGGMLLGPGPRGPVLPELPPGAVPPGAGYDPIGPVLPGNRSRDRPDFDHMRKPPGSGYDNYFL